MGNCLKRSTADDISLLRGNESSRDSSDQIGPAPFAVNDFGIQTFRNNKINRKFSV